MTETDHEALARGVALLPELKRLSDEKETAKKALQEYGLGGDEGEEEYLKLEDNVFSANHKIQNAAIIALPKLIAALESAERIAKPVMLSGGDGMVLPKWVKNHFAERLRWADGDGLETVDVNAEALREALSPAPASNGEAVAEMTHDRIEVAIAIVDMKDLHAFTNCSEDERRQAARRILYAPESHTQRILAKHWRELARAALAAINEKAGE